MKTPQKVSFKMKKKKHDKTCTIAWWTEPHIGGERTVFPLLPQGGWFRKHVNLVLFPSPQNMPFSFTG